MGELEGQGKDKKKEDGKVEAKAKTRHPSIHLAYPCIQYKISVRQEPVPGRTGHGVGNTQDGGVRVQQGKHTDTQMGQSIKPTTVEA